MKIVIIGAMEQEVVTLVSQLKDTSIEKKSLYTFYCGKMFDHDIIIVASGVGKVASGMLMATLYDHFFEIDLVINVGVAGGVSRVAIGDVVIGDAYVYGDVDVTSFGTYQYGQMPRFPAYFSPDAKAFAIAKDIGDYVGGICTMDRFVVDSDMTDELIASYFKDRNILCFDMETAAFAQSCHFFNLPFIAIRAISDVIGANLDDSFEKNLEFACSKSTNAVLNLIQQYK